MFTNSKPMVSVTRDGRRIVDVNRLFRSEKVQKALDALDKKLETVKSANEDKPKTKA